MHGTAVAVAGVVATLTGVETSDAQAVTTSPISAANVALMER